MSPRHFHADNNDCFLLRLCHLVSLIWKYHDFVESFRHWNLSKIYVKTVRTLCKMLKCSFKGEKNTLILHSPYETCFWPAEAWRKMPLNWMLSWNSNPVRYDRFRSNQCGLVMPYGDRAASTLARVMACYLKTPSQFLNECWLIFSGILLYSYVGNFLRND